MKDFTEEQILGKKSPSREGEDICSRLRRKCVKAKRRETGQSNTSALESSKKFYMANVKVQDYSYRDGWGP